MLPWAPSASSAATGYTVLGDPCPEAPHIWMPGGADARGHKGLGIFRERVIRASRAMGKAEVFCP